MNREVKQIYYLSTQGSIKNYLKFRDRRLADNFPIMIPKKDNRTYIRISLLELKEWCDGSDIKIIDMVVG